jgi:mono/diheme cytochrome c family protein
MKAKKIYFLLPLAVIGGAILLMSSTKILIQERGPWVAPVKADTIKNPLKGNSGAAVKGKITFEKYCKVCHGFEGRGNGLAVPELPVKPADLSSEKVQKQSDGILFWKMSTGRAPMAAYEQALTKEERWQLVNYIRNLKAF